MADVVVDFLVAGPTLARFLESIAFVIAIMGPLGSGKTSAAIMKMLLAAARQAPGPDGIRRTRWVVVRNTYAELRSTTLKSFEQWVPVEVGKLTFDAPIVFRLRRGDVDAEFLFIALDREEDQRKLLSLECTGAWINEAREVPKGIVDTLTGRVGRFPPMKDGGATWAGVLMDTNPPDTEHWWYRAAEVDRPHGWEFFKQPAGDGPDAENLANLPAGYYARVKAGKDPDWIKVYVGGEYGYLVEGKPVYPMFRDSVHVATEPIPYNPVLPLLLGVDFGLTPAAAMGQRGADGRWLVIDELVTDDLGTVRFAELLTAHVATHYPRAAIEGWGDPAGAQRGQTDERSCLDVLRANTGWRWHAAPDNALALRLDSVKAALNRMIDGRPGFLLSPKCAVLRKGFNGGYHYRMTRSTTGAGFAETPAKNGYSHPHDALQYLMSGGGEAAVLMRRDRVRDVPEVAVSDYPMFG